MQVKEEETEGRKYKLKKEENMRRDRTKRKLNRIESKRKDSGKVNKLKTEDNKRRAREKDGNLHQKEDMRKIERLSRNQENRIEKSGRKRSDINGNENCELIKKKRWKMKRNKGRIWRCFQG